MIRKFYSKSKNVKVDYEMGKDYSYITMNDVQTQIDLPTGFKDWRIGKQKEFLEGFADDIDDISLYLPKLALAGVNKIIINWEKLNQPDRDTIDAYDTLTGEILNISSIPYVQNKYPELKNYFNKYTKRSTLLHELVHAIDINKESNIRYKNEMKASLVESRYLNDKISSGNLSGKDLEDVQFGLKTSMDYLNFWKQKAVE